MNTPPITNRGNLESGSWLLRSRARNDELPWLLVFLFYLLLNLTPSHAAEHSPIPKPSHTLHLHDGALTVRVTATPLREVMAEVSRLSGSQVVWGTDNGERQISVNFTALPLDEGLRRVLDRYNFMFVYAATDEKSRLTQIWISSAIGAVQALEPSPSAQVVPTAPAMPETGETWDVALSTFAQRDEMAQSAAFLEEESKAGVEENGK